MGSGGRLRLFVEYLSSEYFGWREDMLTTASALHDAGTNGCVCFSTIGAFPSMCRCPTLNFDDDFSRASSLPATARRCVDAQRRTTRSQTATTVDGYIADTCKCTTVNYTTLDISLSVWPRRVMASAVLRHKKSLPSPLMFLSSLRPPPQIPCCLDLHNKK